MTVVRIAVVVAVVVFVVLATIGYRRWRAAAEGPVGTLPAVPERFLAPGPTWLLFTTRYCTTCDQVAGRLAASDPEAAVVTVAVEEEPLLAKAYKVRSAPTVLRAGPDGEVAARLVGADAVDDWLRTRA